MKKYYATRGIIVDNKIYNQGDIVFTDNPIDGLKLLDEQQQVKTYNGAYISDEPVISIMITFHNKEKYAKKCIQSFIEQTIRIPYEIIAIDDASTDKTADILKSFGNKIRYFRVENKSAAKSRNFGLKQMRGKYWTFFDGDDFCYATYLEALYNGIQGYDVCATRYSYELAERQNIIPTCNFFEYDERILSYCGMINTPIMVKKELGEKLEWDTNLFCYEDWNISLQLRELGAKVNLIREKHWKYVDNSDSKWGSGEVSKYRLENYNYMLKKWNLKPVKAEVSFFSLISQDRTLDEYFDCIKEMKMPKDKMHWIIVVDNKNVKMLERVKEKAKDFNFLTTKIYFTNEQDDYMSHNFTERANRITRNLKYMINEAIKFNNYTPFFFMLEDDTLAPKNAFQKLWKLIKDDEQMVYVSGVEPAKSADRHLGVGHLYTNEQGEIFDRIIPAPKKSGLESFESGGWYCWIGRTDILAKHKFRVIEDGRYLGPDTLMVYDLKRQGYKTMTDWSIACKHYDWEHKHWIPVSEGRGYHFTYSKQRNGSWTFTQVDL